MKRATECRNCSLCVKELPVGFTSQERLYCTDRRCYVDPNDGCTFGVKGNPSVASSGIEVYIEGHAAVYGRYEE